MSYFSALFAPQALWQATARQLAADPRGSAWRLGLLVLAGALGGAAAVWVGTRWLTVDWNEALGYIPPGPGRINAVPATFGALLLAPLLLAAVYVLLLPLYRRPRQPLAALAVAVVGALPIYLASFALFFMPAVLLLFAAVFVGIFWWAHGVRLVLGVGERDAIEFNVIALLLAGLALQFAGGGLGALF